MIPILVGKRSYPLIILNHAIDVVVNSPVEFVEVTIVVGAKVAKASDSSAELILDNRAVLVQVNVLKEKGGVGEALLEIFTHGVECGLDVTFVDNPVIVRVDMVPDLVGRLFELFICIIAGFGLGESHYFVIICVVDIEHVQVCFFFSHPRVLAIFHL